MGRGSDGWVEILDDAVAGFGHRGWLQLGWSGDNAENGEVHPAVGNIDTDAAAEIIFGLGPTSGQGGWMQVLDDAVRGHASLGWKNAADSAVYSAGAATYPAIGRRR